jgi:hypothetical protein
MPARRRSEVTVSKSLCAVGLCGALMLAPLACGESSDDGSTSSGGTSNGGSSSGGTAGSATGGASGTSTAGASGSGTGGAGNSAGSGSDAGPDSSGGSAGVGPSADSVWSELSVLEIVKPMDYGAAGNGIDDDLDALIATVNALPDAGGIVYLPLGASFLKTNVLVVTKSHVKWWAPEGAEIFQRVGGVRRRQSILCRNTQGCGFFGVNFGSDASERFDALEDNHISADRASLVEVVGCDIEGAAASGVFLYGSTEHYIEGNYIHRTWADHVHHTNGASGSWVWNNYIFNQTPSRGDDGVACVTYGPASTRCRDMEWWNNTILHTDWGRGYSVIGGDDIHIHDNWAIGVAGAGIIIASESSYDSASSSRITVRNNTVYQSGHSIGHPGILVSGLNPAADPLDQLSFSGNVSADNIHGPYRAEGEYTNVTGLESTTNSLSQSIPGHADVKKADTSILRTRDVSHVDAAFRPGLHRIHVREAPDGASFQQRFEYVVKGPPAAITAFVAARSQAGDYLSEQRAVDGTTYAILLSSQPLQIPSDVLGVTFRELRTGDLSGALTWLWTRLDAGSY